MSSEIREETVAGFYVDKMFLLLAFRIDILARTPHSQDISLSPARSVCVKAPNEIDLTTVVAA